MLGCSYHPFYGVSWSCLHCSSTLKKVEILQVINNFSKHQNVLNLYNWPYFQLLIISTLNLQETKYFSIFKLKVWGLNCKLLYVSLIDSLIGIEPMPPLFTRGMLPLHHKEFFALLTFPSHTCKYVNILMFKRQPYQMIAVTLRTFFDSHLSLY